MKYENYSPKWPSHSKDFKNGYGHSKDLSLAIILVGTVSVYCDWVRGCWCYGFYLSVAHVKTVTHWATSSKDDFVTSANMVTKIFGP